MSLKSKVSNMFTNNKSKKGGNMATTDNYDVLDKLWGGTATATSGMIQQDKEEMLRQMQMEQYKQLANTAYGQQLANQVPGTLGTALGAATTTTWGPGTVQYQQPIYTTTNTEPAFRIEEMENLMMLQVINLITNVGPAVAKKIIRRFKINFSDAKFEQVTKDLAKASSDDDDPDLDKVINDAVKEVKL